MAGLTNGLFTWFHETYTVAVLNASGHWRRAFRYRGRTAEFTPGHRGLFFPGEMHHGFLHEGSDRAQVALLLLDEQLIHQAAQEMGVASSELLAEFPSVSNHATPF